MEETKKCPYCGETIKTVAKKCRHCGEWLDKAEEPKYNYHTSATSKAPSNKVSALKYSVIAIIIILIAVFAYIIVSKSDGGKVASSKSDEIEEIDTTPIEEVVEESASSNSLVGMSCMAACYHNVEWRLKYSRAAHAVAMELEVSKKGENNFYPTNCYYDTYGDYSGITKDCASYLYTRFNPIDNWDDDYTPTFLLTPDSFTDNAVVKSQSY